MTSFALFLVSVQHSRKKCTKAPQPKYWLCVRRKVFVFNLGLQETDKIPTLETMSISVVSAYPAIVRILRLNIYSRSPVTRTRITQTPPLTRTKSHLPLI